MRRITMFNRVSADGCFTDAGGGLGWVVPEPELDKAAADNLGANGTILFGRRTYEMFESFWPHVTADAGSGANPHGLPSPQMLAMAEWINAAEKIVFSRTRQEVTWTNSRLIREFDPAVVQALKDEPGQGMMIFGSGEIVSLLSQHGLIDDYTVIVSPLILGSARPLFGVLPESVRLELAEVKAFPSGNVRLRYTRV